MKEGIADYVRLVLCFAILFGFAFQFAGRRTIMAAEKERVYKIDFTGRRCEFCGCKKAERFVFECCPKHRTEKLQYLCDGCYEFVYYGRNGK